MSRKKKHKHPAGHKEFHLVIRGSAPSQEAEKFAKKLMRKIELVRKKHFPDTTVYNLKLGHLA